MHVHRLVKQIKRFPVHFQLKGRDVQQDTLAGNDSNSLGSAIVCRHVSLKVEDNCASNLLLRFQSLLGEPVAIVSIVHSTGIDEKIDKMIKQVTIFRHLGIIGE